jgi:protein-S-isoprenylcysteine O-methyltransferase Ste14
MWGLALETAAVLVAWFGPPVEPGAARIAAAMALAPVGAALAWWAVEHLGRQWRIQAGLWHDHRLVRTGPYRFMRHPIFASILAMVLATALLRTTWPGIALAAALFVAGTEIRVRIEDRLLASRFGAEFEDYRRGVRAYLPYLR